MRTDNYLADYTAGGCKLIIYALLSCISTIYKKLIRRRDSARELYQWRRKRYGRYRGRHTNLKFSMAVPYRSDVIWAVDSRENY